MTTIAPALMETFENGFGHEQHELVPLPEPKAPAYLTHVYHGWYSSWYRYDFPVGSIDNVDVHIQCCERFYPCDRERLGSKNYRELTFSTPIDYGFGYRNLSYITQAEPDFCLVTSLSSATVQPCVRLVHQYGPIVLDFWIDTIENPVPFK